MQVNSKRNEKHPELQSNQRVLQASATTVSIGPNAPSNPTAVEASASQVNLAWTVSATPGVTYSVFRGGSSGFAPGSTNLIASGVGATFHADTGIRRRSGRCCRHLLRIESSERHAAFGLLAGLYRCPGHQLRGSYQRLWSP